VTGFKLMPLPEASGSCWFLTGVATSNLRLRFPATGAGGGLDGGINGYPPDSQVNPLTTEQTDVPLLVAATASVAPGFGSECLYIDAAADAQVVSTSSTKNYGASNSLFVESSASGFGNEPIG